MKIINVTSLNEVAGVYTYCVSLNRVLHDMGHEIYFVINKKSHVSDQLIKDLNLDFTRVHFIYFRGFFNKILARLKFKKIAKTISPDVIISHEESSFLLSFSDKSAKHINIIHNSKMNVNIIPSNIVCVNDIREIIVRSLQLSEDVNTKKRVFCLPPCLEITDKEQYENKLSKLDSDYKFPKNDKKIVLGSLSRLHSYKKVDLAIKTIDYLIKKKNIDIHLHIAGVGEERSRLEKLVCELNLQDRVKFLGYLNSNEVLKFLEEIDILLLSSVAEEFGIVVIEAWKVFVPVIAVRNIGTQYIIDNGENGILVDESNEQAVVEALEDFINLERVEKIKMIKCASSKLINKFTFESCKKRIEHIMKKLY